MLFIKANADEIYFNKVSQTTYSVMQDGYKYPTFAQGTVVDITASYKEGYHLEYWNWFGSKIFDETLTFTIGSETHSLYGYPVGKANKYSLHFNANGGEGEMEDQTLTYDTAAKITKCSYTRPGYEFAGWAKTEADANSGKVDYTDEKSVSNITSENAASVELYAVWKPITYPLTLSVPSGYTIVNNITSYTYGVETALPTTITMPTNIVAAGWKFVGWYEASDCSGSAMLSIGNAEMGEKTLVAGFVNPAIGNTPYPNPDDVVIPGPGSTPVPTPRATFGPYDNNLVDGPEYVVEWNQDWSAEIITLPTNMKRDGYTWNGWYLNADFTGDAVTTMKKSDLDAGVKVYGKWTPNTYKITYVLNGGTLPSGAPKTYTVGTGIDLKKITPSINETVPFMYWCEDAELTKRMEITKDTFGDLTLYAKWGPKGVVSGNYMYHITSTSTCVLVGCLNASKLTNKTLTVKDKVTLTYKGKTKTYRVTRIANKAFAGVKLKKAVVGKYVGMIGKSAFKGCKSLKAVTIKSTALYSIRENAFRSCSKLTKITIKSKKLTSAKKYSMKGVSKKCVVKVPGAKLKKYKKVFKKANMTKGIKIKK